MKEQSVSGQKACAYDNRDPVKYSDESLRSFGLMLDKPKILRQGKIVKMCDKPFASCTLSSKLYPACMSTALVVGTRALTIIEIV